MLGPLALAASGMEFTALSSNDDLKTSDLGDSIRNICNSTLTLLYTVALLIWGLAVNRQRAWRTDGGTASFGGGAVGLAILNTAISFVEIAYDRLWWLPDVCWTLTIWQSWLGFWWWVGAGMVSFFLLFLWGAARLQGKRIRKLAICSYKTKHLLQIFFRISQGIGEVEDRAERVAKKRKREERRRRKLEKAERLASKKYENDSGHGGGESSAIAGGGDSDVMEGMRRLRGRIVGSASVLGMGSGRGTARSNDGTISAGGSAVNGGGNGILSRRRRNNNEGDADQVQSDGAANESGRNNRVNFNDENPGETALESIAIGGNEGEESTRNQTQEEEGSSGEGQDQDVSNDAQTVAGSSSSNAPSTSTNPTGTALSSSENSSGVGNGFIGWIASHQPGFLKRRVRRLKLEHAAAARVVAEEQSVIREQVMSNGRGGGNGGLGLRGMMDGNNRNAVAGGSGTVVRTSSNSNSNPKSHNRKRSSINNSNGTPRNPNSNLPTPRTPNSNLPSSNLSNPPINQNSTTTTNSNQEFRNFNHSNDSRRSDGSNGGSGGQLTGTTAADSGENGFHLQATNQDEEDGWIEEDDDVEEGEAEQGNEEMVERNEGGPASIRGRSESRTRDQDKVQESSNLNRNHTSQDQAQSSRQAREEGVEEEEGEEGQSWYWKGGLKNARLRDRTTYD